MQKHKNPQQMKTETKINLILLVFVVFLILGFGWAIERGNNFKAESDQRQSVINEKDAIITFKTNQYGKVVAEKDAAVIKANDLEKSYPEVYKMLKDEMDINAKNLKAFVRNEFAAHGTGTGTIVNNHYYDSSTNSSYDSLKFNTDNNKYLKFNVNFELRFTDGKLKYSQSPYTYSYSDTVSTAISSKKKWFLGSEKLYATTTFKNPDSKIYGATNILVNNYKDKRFSIGVGAGYGIVVVGNNVHTGWFVGPSIEYTLFKF